MSHEAFERYEDIRTETTSPQPTPTAEALGGLMLNYVLFNGLLMGELGSAAHAASIFGPPETFAHTTAAIAEVNGLAPAQPERQQTT